MLAHVHIFDGGQDASNLPFKLITSRILSEVVRFGGSVGTYDREKCRDEQQGRDGRMVAARGLLIRDCGGLSRSVQLLLARFP